MSRVKVTPAQCLLLSLAVLFRGANKTTKPHQVRSTVFISVWHFPPPCAFGSWQEERRGEERRGEERRGEADCTVKKQFSRNGDFMTTLESSGVVFSPHRHGCFSQMRVTTLTAS